MSTATRPTTVHRLAFEDEDRNALVSGTITDRVAAAIEVLGSRTGAPALVLSGLPLELPSIGPTPANWQEGGWRPERAVRILIQLAIQLGRPFAWRTQQDGRLVHDVLPTRGDETEQLGSSSAARLMWHTEDAFHPDRSSFLGLLCLRNPDHVPTTIGGISKGILSAEEERVLRERRFRILPDKSHLANRNFHSGQDDFAAIEAMTGRPDSVSALFGPPDDPFLRLDPAFMSATPDDVEAARCLNRVCAAVDETLAEVRLRPGHCLLLDNYRLVHGRNAFRARYDGSDRWLKRVNIASQRRERPLP